MHVGLWVHICHAPHIYVGLSLLLHIPHRSYRSVPTSLCRPTHVSRPAWYISPSPHTCISLRAYIPVSHYTCVSVCIYMYVCPCTGILGVRLHHHCVAADLDFRRSDVFFQWFRRADGFLPCGSGPICRCRHTFSCGLARLLFLGHNHHRDGDIN